MFARAPDDARPDVALKVDGAEVVAKAGDSVAAAILASGRLAFRATPVTGRPRGPFCMMGVCFDCLVAIDGVPGRQACMVTVAEGMRVDTLHAGPAP